jgi:6-pyruvoyltetrahydropterin/6-carboxytetrahydropterin synthase
VAINFKRQPGTFYSTKKYGHDLGISACFRQPAATHSHCSKLHGYALSFEFIFGCSSLDDKNWVADFGGFKKLKQNLIDTFDHKTVVDAKDPEMDFFIEANKKGIIDLVTMEHGVGCERFAEYAFNLAQRIVDKAYPDGRVWVESCECSEHGSNSAIFVRAD